MKHSTIDIQKTVREFAKVIIQLGITDDGDEEAWLLGYRLYRYHLIRVKWGDHE
jgi:hypothetical protein